MALWNVTYTTSVYAEDENDAKKVLLKDGIKFTQEIKVVPFDYGTDNDKVAVNHSFHGSLTTKCWIVYDTNNNGYAEIVFAKEEDAIKYLQIRKHAGWNTFEIMERYVVKDAILGIGPSVSEKHPGCVDCQTRADDESFIVEKVLASPPSEVIEN